MMKLKFILKQSLLVNDFVLKAEMLYTKNTIFPKLKQKYRNLCLFAKSGKLRIWNCFLDLHLILPE